MQPGVPPTESNERLTSLDGLRGVAAVAVMLYHYTRRYGDHFDPAWRPLFSYDGQFGVLLFFMISGYVITLTTRRVRRPIDFIFFRFSRLYPTFWVCVAVTAAVLTVSHLPLPRPPPLTPLNLGVNLTMLTKSIRRLPYTPNDLAYVDGAYWSLEIELFFYAVVFALLLVRRSEWMVWVAIVMVAVSAIDHRLLATDRSPVPSAVRWVLFFDYWPYFGIGIAVYAARTYRHYVAPTLLMLLAMMRVFEATWVEAIKMTVCAIVFTAAVYDLLPPLRWRPLVALGAISYPLYLLHQNVGYAVIRMAVSRGVTANAAILLATVTAIAVAALISIAIERPSLHALRRLYKRLTHHTAPAAAVSGLAPAVPLTASDRAVS